MTEVKRNLDMNHNHEADHPENQTLWVELASGNYPIYLGENVLGNSGLWRTHLGENSVLVVSNETVEPLYAEQLLSALPDCQIETHIVPDGEPFKNQQTWSRIIDKLIQMQAKRDTCVIALGGGVVGDITGFAAASYMRGVNFIQVPTTLLAQVDASVGGKTGINHLKGKNLIGAFHQPQAVFIDTKTLETLPVNEFNAGLAEVIKYGVIMDADFFEWLALSCDAIRDRDTQALNYMIGRSVQNKARIVASDEKEAGIRAILNYGHTFGHAIETLTSYQQYLHGEAVAIGMTVAAKLSELRGLCSKGTTDRIQDLLRHFDLPFEVPDSVKTAAMIEAMELDKKALSSGLRLILLNSIGEAIIDHKSEREEIIAAIDDCRKHP